MKSILVFVLAIVSIATIQSLPSYTQKYHSHKVYKVFVDSENKAKIIRNLEHDVGIDFWDSYHRNDPSVRIMVSPEKQNDFELLLKDNGVKFNQIIDDVDAVLQTQKARNDLARSRVQQKHNNLIQLEVEDIYSHFWDLDQVNQLIDEVDGQFTHVTKFSVGKTFEGRDIWGLKISQPNAGEVLDARPIIIVDATIHAREWIATMQAVHLIYELTTRATENAELLDEIDWIIVPVLNPDGFAYTQTERLWRKTRSDSVGTECKGVDPNRNFDYNWDVEGGSSADPCSTTYHGPSAASEIEVQGMQELLLQYNNVKLYLTIHSYGKYLLYPFGHGLG